MEEFAKIASSSIAMLALRQFDIAVVGSERMATET